MGNGRFIRKTNEKTLDTYQFRFPLKKVISSLKGDSDFNYAKDLTSLKYTNRVYYKNTGSNLFITVTNGLGEVILTYSSGMFKLVSTKREKRSYLLSKKLGQIASIKMSKIKKSHYIAILPLSSKRHISTMKTMIYGFGLMKKTRIIKYHMRLIIVRNGVRARKMKRK